MIQLLLENAIEILRKAPHSTNPIESIFSVFNDAVCGVWLDRLLKKSFLYKLIILKYQAQAGQNVSF